MGSLGPLGREVNMKVACLHLIPTPLLPLRWDGYSSKGSASTPLAGGKVQVGRGNAAAVWEPLAFSTLNGATQILCQLAVGWGKQGPGSSE